MRWVGVLVEVFFWWAACLGIWLISLSAVPTQELVLAVAVSLPCGAAAPAARRAANGAWALRARWARSLLMVPVAILSDTAQVLANALPGRRHRGELVRAHLGAAGQGPSAEAHGWRAFATWVICVTPGTFVVDVSSEEGSALVHRLTSRGPRTDCLFADKAAPVEA